MMFYQKQQIQVSKFLSTCCFDLLKKNKFQISMKFHLRKRKIIVGTLFFPSFGVLHSSPLVYMDHTKLIFQNILLYCTKKVAENHNNFFHFRRGGETHLLVLAQTLIYKGKNYFCRKTQKSLFLPYFWYGKAIFC